MCTGNAVGVGDLDDLGDRLDGADLVVGPHHRDDGDARGIALDGCAEGVDVEPAQVVDLDAARPWRPRRPSQCSGSSTAWCSIGVLRMRVRRGSSARRAQNSPLTARLSDSVPPEVNTTSPGRQFSARRNGLAGLLHDPAGLAAGGVQGRRVADPAELGSHRRCCFGKDRRGRRVVEIDGHPGSPAKTGARRALCGVIIAGQEPTRCSRGARMPLRPHFWDPVGTCSRSPSTTTPPPRRTSRCASRSGPGWTTGRLTPGTKLPTVRGLAAELGLAANTIARAYRELEGLGVIETRGRAGSVVTGSGHRAGSPGGRPRVRREGPGARGRPDEALALVRRAFG